MTTPRDERKSGDQPKLPPDDATQEALRNAALHLLNRDGVLAGINLQEVADFAGVNRSLVYHHFGSRQQLLRAALRLEGHVFLEEVAQDLPHRYPERMRRFFWASVRYARAVALGALLVLDGDDHVQTLPLRNRTLANLRRDVADHVIRSDVDVEALHIGVVASVYGYALYRERFAEETKISLGELDRRVEAVLAELLRSVVLADGENEDGECGART